MQIKSRIKRLEQSNYAGEPCQCPENTFAASTTAFIELEKCRRCAKVIKPSILVVKDLSEIEGFNFPVKVYAGFNPDLV